MATADLTAARLRELFRYEPETGLFFRLLPKPRLKPSGSPQPTGHLNIGIDGRTHGAHRLAWLYMHGSWPQQHIDHINGNPADNRISNLRDVSRGMNMQNQRQGHADHKHTSLLGACWNEKRGRWLASLSINGKSKSIGWFRTDIEAHAAYLDAKRAMHAGCTI